MMKTVMMTAEQTATYDAGDARASDEMMRHLCDVMDSTAEHALQGTRGGSHERPESVTVELHTADGIVVDAHTYHREPESEAGEEVQS